MFSAARHGERLKGDAAHAFRQLPVPGKLRYSGRAGVV
jgi:hypothetical protein